MRQYNKHYSSEFQIHYTRYFKLLPWVKSYIRHKTTPPIEVGEARRKILKEFKDKENIFFRFEVDCIKAFIEEEYRTIYPNRFLESDKEKDVILK